MLCEISAVEWIFKYETYASVILTVKDEALGKKN